MFSNELRLLNIEGTVECLRNSTVSFINLSCPSEVLLFVLLHGIPTSKVLGAEEPTNFRKPGVGV